MNSFTVYPQKIQSTSEDFETMNKELQRYAGELENVKGSLSKQSSYMELVKSLDTVYNNILENAAKLNTMHKALEMIAQEYISCESRICDIPSDKRNLFQKILAFLRIGDKRYRDSTYYDTNEEEEYAQDCYMKDQIATILAQSQYSEETWASATTEERKQMLTNFMNEIAAIYGVDINKTINFTNTGPEKGSINLGSYAHGTQSVNINQYYMENYDSSYDLMYTIIHELRHAYQHQAVDNPEKFIVTQETIDIWKCNFENYVSPGEDFDLYREQAVEIDARDFESLKY